MLVHQFQFNFQFLFLCIWSRLNSFHVPAVALTHLDDPDNAEVAYGQAMQLDKKDPAIPLNFAVLLFNQNRGGEAHGKMVEFEERVRTLRQSPGLDADPDVSN